VDTEETRVADVARIVGPSTVRQKRVREHHIPRLRDDLDRFDVHWGSGVAISSHEIVVAHALDSFEDLVMGTWENCEISTVGNLPRAEDDANQHREVVNTSVPKRNVTSKKKEKKKG